MERSVPDVGWRDCGGGAVRAKPTAIEEVLELHKHHSEARYVSQSEFNDIFNGMPQDQRIVSRNLESEAEQRGDWWFKNGWCGQFVDGKLVLSDVRCDPYWPAMFANSKKILESENRQDVINEFHQICG